MKSTNHFILIILLFACTAAPSFATGPSTATIQIVPISYNDSGVILCKTAFSINRTGGVANQRIQYGWLAVSSSGIWEEVPHALIEDPYNPINENTSDKYAKEFKDDMNWKLPPNSVKSLIKKYSFRDRGNFVGDNKAITWSPSSICNAKKCTNAIVKQQSLQNLHSALDSGSSIKPYFSYAGVFFFHNSYGPEKEQVIGADIHISNLFDGQDIGIDYWDIDGIAFITDATLK